MFYLFYGTDTDKARAKMHEVLSGAQKKRPDAEVFTLDADHFSENELDGLIGGMGLFEKKYIVVLDRIFEKKETIDLVLEKIKEIAETENLFLFLEGKLDKKTLTKLEKHAHKVQEFSLPKTDGGRKFGLGGGAFVPLDEFNVFSLADAFGKRDKKNLWALYQKAVTRDIPSEEVSGILFWQLKSMILATGGRSATEAGLNPYVFTKSKTFARNYKKEELRDLSSRLVGIYHDAHRGIHDFEIALERFVLEV